MSKLVDAIEILENGTSGDRVALVQPAIKKAIEKKMLPSYAPIDLYEQNWAAMKDILITFANTVEDKVGTERYTPNLQLAIDEIQQEISKITMPPLIPFLNDKEKQKADLYRKEIDGYLTGLKKSIDVLENLKGGKVESS